MNKMNKKGFTLIEMLVVIAIIAVLVSIVIPVVGDSTEKAREAADAANIRAAISEVTTKGMVNGADQTVTVTLTQKTSGWASVTDIGGFETTGAGAVPSTGTVTVTYTHSTATVTVG